MRDPYDVLGLQRGASDDEIKKAYRTLSRQYHPDANVNNPNKAQAEERFKEVQQAYDAIQHEKEGGGYGPGSSRGGAYSSYGDFSGFGGAWSGFGGFSGFGGSAYRDGSAGAQSEADLHLQAAQNYINSRHYQEALNVLGQMTERDGRWYYLSAAANMGVGNNVQAKVMAQRAVELDPNNLQYRQLLEQMESGGSWYQGMGSAYGYPMETGADLCPRMCLASVACSMCGPGVFCCI